MKIYIAGKITGDPDYREKFNKAEAMLMAKGHSVMNPAWIDGGSEFSWHDYMKVSATMQRVCDAALFLPGWSGSRGARREMRRAFFRRQKVFLSVDAVPGAACAGLEHGTVKP